MVRVASDALRVKGQHTQQPAAHEVCVDNGRDALCRPVRLWPILHFGVVDDFDALSRNA
jgi:hypothetical protein